MGIHKLICGGAVFRDLPSPVRLTAMLLCIRAFTPRVCSPRESMKSAAGRELAFADYWNKRYAGEQAGKNDEEEGEDYEWLKTFEKLKPFLEMHLPAVKYAPKILQLGCGTSVCQ